MICCKQIPIPILSIPYKKIVFLHDNLQHLFSARYENRTAWKSFDLIVDGKKSALLKHLSELTDWIILLEKTTAINHIKHMYLAVLAPYNQIPWHYDRSDHNFDKSFITSIHTQKSFIEFANDKKYVYKQGYSYIIRSGIEHKIFNLNNSIRITLCTTPKENPYA